MVNSFSAHEASTVIYNVLRDLFANIAGGALLANVFYGLSIGV